MYVCMYFGIYVYMQIGNSDMHYTKTCPLVADMFITSGFQNLKPVSV